MLAALALTSCNSDKQEVVPTTTSPTPPPATRTTTTTAPSAPAVANPLDASDFEASPCTSLTKAQQQQYGITRTERTTLAATEGESCFFHRPGTDDPIWVVFSSKISNGLTYRYIEHERGSWGYWKPTELDGYPAVAFGNTDPPACFFAVGISDSLHFSVSASTDKTCTESRQVAATILANIEATN
ncbi:MAG: DUF3558 domain-containing protein [Actinomycetota bacterium]|nr:DUF3558 domain-containing protein [Actinomycetota bacterium]